MSSVRSGSRIYIFLDLVEWLNDGHKPYMSANNVVCCYEEVLLRSRDAVLDTVILRELLRNQPRYYLIDCVRQERLGARSEDRRVSRLFSRERFSHQSR